MLAIEEKSGQIRSLINVGKERGYLLSDELNGVLAAGEHTAEEVETLFASFESDGIEIYEDASAAKAAHRKRKLGTSRLRNSGQPAPISTGVAACRQAFPRR